MSVRNYTIGDPTQPGKMVVLNGAMDMYDASNNQTVSNGQLVGTRHLGNTRTTTTVNLGNNTTDTQISQVNFVIPTGVQFIKVDAFVQDISVSGANANASAIIELWKGGKDYARLGNFLNQAIGVSVSSSIHTIYFQEYFAVGPQDWGTTITLSTFGFMNTGTATTGVVNNFTSTPSWIKAEIL